MLTLRARQVDPYDAPWEDALNYVPTRQVFERLTSHGFTCACCGLVSRPTKKVPSGYMEIHPVDGEDAVLCAVCSTTQVLSREVRGEIDHGHVVLCPEIPFSDFMRIVIFGMVAEFRGGDLKEPAELWRRDMVKSRHKLVGPALGLDHVLAPDGILTPGEFATLYQDLTPDLLSSQDNLFAGLRYIPLLTHYGRQAAFYSRASHTFSSLDESAYFEVEDV